MNCVFQVKMGGQRSQIIGVMIHVMAVAHLGGAATTLEPISKLLGGVDRL